MKRTALVLLAALALVAAVIAYRRSTAHTARVASGPIHERVVAPARVVASDGLVVVTSHDAGRVLRVLVREGDPVGKGQALAELEAEEGGTKPSALKAPIAGVVVGSHVERGSRVGGPAREAQPLFELADAAKTELRAEFDEDDADRLALDLPALVTTQGGREALAHGRVARLSSRIERRTIGVDDSRVRAVSGVRVASIAWEAGGARPPIGRALEVAVNLPERPAAARLPKSAIQIHDGRPVVEVAWGPWFRDHAVEVGATDGENAEVRGIAEGTVVRIP